MPDLPPIGVEAILKDDNFQSGLSRFLSGTDQMSNRANSLASVLSGAFAVGTGAAVAAIGGFAAAAKVGLDATMQWGTQVNDLMDVFGMSGSEASTFATALGTVGMSASDGSSAFNYFIKQLSSSKETMNAAASAYASAVSDIQSSNASAIADINAKWTQAQQDAANKTRDIWDNFATQRQDIERNLGESLSDMQESFDKRYEKSVKDANKSAAKSEKDARKDNARSLAELEKEEKAKLAKVSTDEEKKAIKEEYDLKRKDLAEKLQLRLDDIAEAKKERLAEIEEQRKEDQAELNEQKERMKSKAAYQIERAHEAAQKQADAVAEGLKKEEAARAAALKKQEADFDKAMAKAKEALAKASSTNPLEKALKQLGISMNELMGPDGKIKPFSEIMPKVMDAFQKLPPGVDASALALQLFGRSGIGFIDFLRGATGSMEDARKKMKDWGLEMSTEDADAVEAFGFSLEETKMRLQGIWNQIGLAVLPIVRDMVDYINKNVLPVFIQWAKDIGPKVTEFLQGLGTTAGEVFKLIKEQKWDELSAKFWSWIDTAKTNASTKLGEITTAIANYLKDHWEPDIKPQLIAWVTKFWNWITDPKEGLLVTVTDNMAKVLTSIANWVKSEDARKNIRGVGKDIGTGIVDAIGALFESKDTSKSLGDKLTTGLRGIKSALGDVLSTVGSELATGVLEGILNKFLAKETVQAIADAFKKTMEDMIQLMVKTGSWSAFSDALVKLITDAITKALTGKIPTMPIGSAPKAGAYPVALPGASTANYSSVNTQYSTYNLNINSSSMPARVAADFGIMRSLAGA